jgi:uncharacterized membrane protein YedE/YeeE
MDLVPFIDAYGEPMTAMAGGAVVGAVFGIAAQRSRFCTRTAVIDVSRRGDWRAFAVWAAGFATALLAVQIMLRIDALSVDETRFFSTVQSLSGAVVGGLVFGIGMVLTRGCVSRLLVLGASGNLRAVFGLLIVTLFAYLTFAGALAPLRDWLASWLTTAATGSNEVLALGGFTRATGIALGVAALVGALALAAVSRASPARFAGGLLVGASVAAGWWFTWQLSAQVFEPIQVESVSFVRPFATTLMLALGWLDTVSLDQGLLAGAIVGAIVSALLSGEFKIVTFAEPGAPGMIRYAIGAALMGFGGILAVGCTVGAGLTGGSVLALTSLLALAAMMAGAAITDRVVAAPKP